MSSLMRSAAVTIAVLATSFSFLAIVSAQQPADAPARKVSDALLSIQSSDLPAREAGFNELMTALASDDGEQEPAPDIAEVLTRFFGRHPNQAEQVKLGLIRLLVRENKTFITDKSVPPGSFTEDDSEYHSNVIEAVSSLNDNRAVAALVGQ
jgi:hypothetical protein